MNTQSLDDVEVPPPAVPYCAAPADQYNELFRACRAVGFHAPSVQKIVEGRLQCDWVCQWGKTRLKRVDELYDAGYRPGQSLQRLMTARYQFDIDDIGLFGRTRRVSHDSATPVVPLLLRLATLDAPVLHYVEPQQALDDVSFGGLVTASFAGLLRAVTVLDACAVMPLEVFLCKDAFTVEFFLHTIVAVAPGAKKAAKVKELKRRSRRKR
jgi:hypothetical protein